MTQQHKSAVIEDSSGNILTEIRAVLNLSAAVVYIYELHPVSSLPETNQTPNKEAESLPVPREEIEEALHNLKAGQSPGVGNIPSESLKNG